MRLFSAGVLLSCLTLAGCAGNAAFATSFPMGPDRLEAALSSARQRQASEPAPNEAYVVGVAEEPRGVFAYDLRARRMLFRQPAHPVALPVIAGPFVIVPEADKVSVRNLRDGALVREIANEGMRLIGADGDSSLTAIVLSSGGALDPRSRLVLMEGTKVTSDKQVGQLIGRPAVLGGLAFVPHHRVLLSVVDARGEERARVRIQHDVSSYAFTQSSDIYFGQQGMYLLDEALTRENARTAPYLALDMKGKLPGNPTLMPDVAAPAPPVDSAVHHVSLSGLPTRVGTRLSFEDDALYLSFYRLLFSLTPNGSSARWAHRTESDLVGVRAVPGGLVAVEQRGRIVALDAKGRVAYEGDLGTSALAVNIQAMRFDFAKASGDPRPAASSLVEAASDPDTRLVPAQAFAATLLGQVEDDEAARGLITLCSQLASNERVGEAACAALGTRPWPSDAVLAALEQHADFITQRPAPPVGTLADAALAGNDARAVPLLLQHLNDPVTPVEALPPLLRAVGVLGDAASAAPIAAFVQLYHADLVELELEEALNAGMEALGKLDPKRARGVLEPIAHDQLARVGVRSAAQNVLATLSLDEAEAAKVAEVEQAAPAEQPAADDEAAPSNDAPEPPAQLRAEHIESALSSVRPDLSRCVRDAPERPASARLVIVIDGEGEVLEVKTLPLSIEACAKALVQSATFPATKYGKRAVMTYVVPR